MENIHVIVISHRRSGTHLTIDTIINNFPYYKNTPAIPSVTLNSCAVISNKDQSVDPIAQLGQTLNLNPCVLKTHSHGLIESYFKNGNCIPFIKKLIRSSKIIYVHRDGRDVLVSLYHYYKRIKKTSIKKDLTFSQFIRMDNDFDADTYSGSKNRISYWKFHVESWISNSNILPLSFSDFHSDYKKTVSKIAIHLQQPLPQNIRSAIRRKDNSFKEFIGKSVRYMLPKWLHTIKYSTVSFRTGNVGEWEQYFSTDDLEYFNQIAGNFNSDLGYN